MDCYIDHWLDSIYYPVMADNKNTTSMSEEELQRLEIRIDELIQTCEQLKEENRLLKGQQQAYSGEQTIKELSGALGLAVQTVYNRLGRIRRQLFDCVAHKLAVAEGSE